MLARFSQLTLTMVLLFMFFVSILCTFFLLKVLVLSATSESGDPSGRHRTGYTTQDRASASGGSVQPDGSNASVPKF